MVSSRFLIAGFYLVLFAPDRKNTVERNLFVFLRGTVPAILKQGQAVHRSVADK